MPRSSASSTKARKTLRGEGGGGVGGGHSTGGSGKEGSPRGPAPSGVQRWPWAHLDSSSLQELVITGLSVLTMHVRADTTPAASSFFTRARTKLGLSWGRRRLSRGAQQRAAADQTGTGDPLHSTG